MREVDMWEEGRSEERQESLRREACSTMRREPSRFCTGTFYSLTSKMLNTIFSLNEQE